MATKKKPVKDKVKQKAKAVKEKLKGRKTFHGAALFALLALFAAGCMDTAPASRATSAAYGDIVVKLADKARYNSVTITLGDGALASADSAGSTETQTATPTLDIRTRIDARYNDAISGATSASRSVLGAIGDGLTGVLDLMQSKKSGTVKVTKADGSAGCVTCSDGQCAWGECGDQ